MIQLHKGDCLEVMQGIETGSIDAIITDPPYGTTACKWDSVIPFKPMWEQLNRIIKTNGAIVLFGFEPFSSALRMSNIKNYKYDWYWNRRFKSNFLNAKRQPMRQIELIHIFYKKQCVYNPQLSEKRKDQIRSNNLVNKIVQCKTVGQLKNGMRGKYDSREIPIDKDYPTHLLQFALPSPNKGRLHPTQKPVPLMEYLIKTYTNEGEVVLDFTMGSGSTGVACVNTKRSFIGIEQDDKYFAIAQERINNAQRQSLIDFPTQ
tara:strand:+ start:70 stop:852 length:783 start_codon:yes stop_codon:yes gene_type:complete